MEDAAAELKRLREVFAKYDDRICQILGEVLGFPRYCDDQKNFPGATPDDGVCTGPYVAEDLASMARDTILKLRKKGSSNDPQTTD